MEYIRKYDDKDQLLCPVHAKPVNKVNRVCDLCKEHNLAHGGRRKAQPKREKYEDLGVERYTYVGKFDPDDFLKWMQRLAKDPVRYAAALSDSRRPGGVNRERYGAAVRRALREPMLNANPETIKSGLMHREDTVKVPRDKLYRTVEVKPQCLGTARNAGGSWRTRKWEVWTLQYGKGLVIVTDDGLESAIYPGWGSLKSAIERSGWEIIG